MEKKDIRFITPLFNKFKQLQKEDRIFEEGEEETKKYESLSKDIEFTVIADMIIRHLLKKFGFEFSLLVNPVEAVEGFINAVEEFLAIFEEEGDTIILPRHELKKILDTVAIAEGAARDLNQARVVKLLKKAHTKIDELLGD